MYRKSEKDTGVRETEKLERQTSKRDRGASGMEKGERQRTAKGKGEIEIHM